VLDRLLARRDPRRAIQQGDQGASFHACGPSPVLSSSVAFVILWPSAGRRAPYASTRSMRIEPRTRSRSRWRKHWHSCPGTSRSGATIIGGISRPEPKAATDFSFFLAITGVDRASVYSLWKGAIDLGRRATDVDRRHIRVVRRRVGSWCAGCCATSRPTAACSSRGIASRSAS